MQPKKPETHADLFRSRLDSILDMNHCLCRLSREIDWSSFEQTFGALYSPGVGRPGLPIRLMAGLHYLKHAYGESDESVMDRWLENPYWQYFCGYEFFQHKFPLHPTALVKWRKRIGEAGMECLLAETIACAGRMGALTHHDVAKVNVDTTVQEKAIAFPTDARLYQKMRISLVREARRQGIELRQTYERVGKKALVMQGRYAHARQMKRSARETRRLKTYLGRVVRDICRKVGQPNETLSMLLSRAERLLEQKRDSKNKLYAVHAPEVECIAKGKAHKRYEFGCKVSIVTTSKRNWIVGMQALHGNPYDGHTLDQALQQAHRLSGMKPKQAFVDQGYKGHGVEDVEVHIVGRRRKKTSRSLKRWLKRRSAVEPVIGHVKQDHGMSRNHLKGAEGDRIHALLCGCGFNIAKLLAIILFAPFYLGRWRFFNAFNGYSCRDRKYQMLATA